jgi:hypothetical protein
MSSALISASVDEWDREHMMVCRTLRIVSFLLKEKTAPLE